MNEPLDKDAFAAGAAVAQELTLGTDLTPVLAALWSQYSQTLGVPLAVDDSTRRRSFYAGAADTLNTRAERWRPRKRPRRRCRTSPRHGYDVGIKRQYSRDVWRTWERNRNRAVPVAETKALLTVAPDGYDIETALGKGLRESNLHIVNWEPAVVAVLKRRYPRITTHGIEMNRVFDERITGRPDAESFDFINLDLCGTLETTAITAACGCQHLREGGILALTWAKGRDPAVALLCDRLGWDRLKYISTVVELASVAHSLREARLVRHEQYSSASHPMEWASWRLGTDSHSLTIRYPDGDTVRVLPRGFAVRDIADLPRLRAVVSRDIGRAQEECLRLLPQVVREMVIADVAKMQAHPVQALAYFRLTLFLRMRANAQSIRVETPAEEDQI